MIELLTVIAALFGMTLAAAIIVGGGVFGFNIGAQLFADWEKLHREKAALRAAEAYLKVAIYDNNDKEIEKQTREVMFRKALIEGVD